jgi:ACS family hexuronate transporter-like MFS transporter
MGLLFTGSSFGAMLAAPLAVGVTARYGFRFAFVATAAVGLLWLPAWLFATREIKGPPEAPRAEDRIPLITLATHPAMVRQMLLVATSAPAILVVLQWFPQYLVETSNVPKEGIGKYLWLPPVLFDVAAVAFGAAASRLDVRRPGSAHKGLVVLAVLMTACLALVPFGVGPWSRVVLASVAMGGGAGMYVLGSADMLRRLPAGAVASATGLSAAVQSLAQIIASPLIGAALDKDHAWGLVLVSLGLFALPGGLLWCLSRTPPLALDADDAERQAA